MPETVHRMRVLQIAYHGSRGGTGGATALRRLHRGLMESGVDTKILCRSGGDAEFRAFELEQSQKAKRIENIAHKIGYKFGLRGLWGGDFRKIIRNVIFAECDVVNYHRTFEFFSYLGFPKLTAEKPSILTLCDMWPLTGHCYASIDCDRWLSGCGKCPYLNVIPEIKRDNTSLEWKLKNWAYERSNLIIVAKSIGMAKKAEQSMLGRFPVHHIPNGIDTETYKSMDKEEWRERLGIPQKKIVMLTAAVGFKNYIKGADLLIEALQKLPHSIKREAVLLLMGKKSGRISEAIDMKTIELGYIEDERIMAGCYSAADFFVMPSRAESFGNVVLESIACGTPVAAFSIDGVSDLVRNGTTGYLARAWNTSDLSDAILEMIENRSERENMGRLGRQIACTEYIMDHVAKRYADLYRSAMVN